MAAMTVEEFEALVRGAGDVDAHSEQLGQALSEHMDQIAWLSDYLQKQIEEVPDGVNILVVMGSAMQLMLHCCDIYATHNNESGDPDEYRRLFLRDVMAAANVLINTAATSEKKKVHKI